MKNPKVRKNCKSHSRDISSKTVFSNAILCAQFLRDNVDVPELKNVQPDDIEDVSERYRPYLGTEFESDTVKKIRIHNNKEKDGEKESIFLVSLIEHKSLVDYDVSMQLLKYMMCIWTEYKRETESLKEGTTRKKNFRYPMIIPIVYYEGKARWTADMCLKDRITGGDVFAKWIPDFRYEVVRVHDYSNEELLARGDEMSLIMLINKIQDAKDFSEFNKLSGSDFSRIIKDSPDSVMDVIVSVIESLCMKIGANQEETRQCIRKVREREMGYLFENMEKMDIQKERRNTQEARKQLIDTAQRLDDTIQKLQNSIQKLIESLQEKGQSREDVKETVQDIFSMEEKEAEEELNKYWK